MPNLYEIDQQILSCCDPETGEILDPEMLTALQMERDTKIEGVVCWVKNLEADAAALNAEKKRFEEREAKAKKKAESLRMWLAEALNGQAFSTVQCAVSFRRSESVDVKTDAAKLPPEMVRTKYEPDKTAIKEALKSGQQIEGCALVTKYNAQIR